MNNETKEITAADVVAFLTKEAAQLAAAVGHEYTFIGCWVGNPAHGQPARVEWKTYSAGTGKHLTDDTLEPLVAETIRIGAPDIKAATLRAEAAALLAEAAALLAEAAALSPSPAVTANRVMISLTAMEQTHTGTASDGAPSLNAVRDELINRVLDCAEFYRWRDNPDGTHTPLFRLKKPLPGNASGTVLPLRALHDILFPTKR